MPKAMLKIQQKIALVASQDKIKSFLLVTVYLIPVALATWFISKFGLNVPFGDQWSLVDLFVKLQNGEASFQDFFAQHNEHRIFFPRVIIALLAFASNWNNKLEMYFSLLLAIVSFFLIYFLAQKTKLENPVTFHAANIICCWLTFSLVQRENWLWGFQIAWFLIDLCLIAAISCLVLPEQKPLSLRLFMAGCFCCLASFSSAHGLFTWLALVPLASFQTDSFRRNILRCGLWLLSFLLIVAIYQIGYVKPSHHPDILFFLREPEVALVYFLNFLGSILNGLILPEKFLGLFLLVNFSLFNIAFLLRPLSLFSNYISPWLALGWFPILFGVITTLGRSGLGVEQALVSRYTTISALFFIALIQMWRILLSLNEGKLKIPLIGAFFFGFMLAIQLTITEQEITASRNWVSDRAEGKICLELAQVTIISQSLDTFSCLTKLHPSQQHVLDRVSALETLGFFHFPKDDELSFESDPAVLRGHIDSPFPESPHRVSDTSKMLNVSGWTALLNQPNIPTFAFLSIGDSPPSGLAQMRRIRRPDVAKALGSENFLNSGWQLAIDPNHIPEGEGKLKVWVYDPKGDRFLKLQDELTILKDG